MVSCFCPIAPIASVFGPAGAKTAAACAIEKRGEKRAAYSVTGARRDAMYSSSHAALATSWAQVPSGWGWAR